MTGLRYLIVPGRGDSAPGHWQSLWQQRLGGERVVQQDWASPRLAPWSRMVIRHLDRSSVPAVLIAHSFGCFAAVAAALRRPERVHAVLLVAPANPARFPESIALPDAPLAAPATLVSSQTDPWLAATEAAAWARLWGCRHVDGGAVGHINGDSGHGDWAFGLEVLAELLATTRPAVRVQAPASTRRATAAITAGVV